MTTTAGLKVSGMKNPGNVSLVQRVKYWLVRLGPANPITRLALHLATRQSGVSLTFHADTITLAKNGDTLVVHSDLSLIPEMGAHPRALILDGGG